MKFEFEERNKKSFLQRCIKEAIVLVIELILVIGLAYGIIHYTIEKTSMLGASMEPTLCAGDEIIVSKMAYRFQDPQRFDVIVFKQSNREHSYYNIKRIIGLPGETIQIKDNTIYINGEPISEEVVVEPMNNPGLAEEEITLEENEYFVLGDNRNNSEDSRFANVGTIIRDEIVGKAWVTLQPFNFIDQMNRIPHLEADE